MNSPSDTQPAEGLVTLAAGDEASGLARMTAQYLEQLLTGSPEKRAEAARLRGRLGLHAREGDVQVTLTFDGGAVTVEEGLQSPDVVISGSLETLLNLLAGRANPVMALARRQVGVGIRSRNLLFDYRAYDLMRLSGPQARKRVPSPVVVVLGIVAAIVLLLWSRQLVRRVVGGR